MTENRREYMKITKRQLKKVIREAISQFEPQKKRGYNAMSDASKSYAQKIKNDFLKLYDAQVGIDAVNGWITVNGKKAVNMSQASGRPLSDEEMISKMEDAMWRN